MRFGFKSLALAAAVLASACETHVEVPSYAAITFSHLPPIALTVAATEAETLYSKPLTAPNVEHEFPVDIARTAEGWIGDRIQAAGASGTATLTVLEASVVETILEKKTGLTGLVTADQGHRYDATLTVSLKAVDLNVQKSAETTITVKRSQTVPEDSTFNEREKIWYELTEKLMADFDAQMTKSIDAHMTLFK